LPSEAREHVEVLDLGYSVVTEWRVGRVPVDGQVPGELVVDKRDEDSANPSLLFREVAFVLSAGFVPAEAVESCRDSGHIPVFERAYDEVPHGDDTIIARSLPAETKLKAVR